MKKEEIYKESSEGHKGVREEEIRNI